MAKKASSSSAAGKPQAARSHGRRKTPSSKPVRKASKPASGKRATRSSKKTIAKPAPKTVTRKKAPPAGKPVARAKAPAPLKGSTSKKGKSPKGEFMFLDHTSEDLFVSQLLEEIEFRHGVDVATIDVRIREGVAVARGTVSDLEELEAVRETMQDAGGITDLTFAVQVAPDRREADRDRARQIQEGLDASAELSKENVLVACVGRKVIVRGTVSSRMRKVKAGRDRHGRGWIGLQAKGGYLVTGVEQTPLLPAAALLLLILGAGVFAWYREGR